MATSNAVDYLDYTPDFHSNWLKWRRRHLQFLALHGIPSPLAQRSVSNLGPQQAIHVSSMDSAKLKYLHEVSSFNFKAEKELGVGLLQLWCWKQQECVVNVSPFYTECIFKKHNAEIQAKKRITSLMYYQSTL